SSRACSGTEERCCQRRSFHGVGSFLRVSKREASECALRGEARSENRVPALPPRGMVSSSGGVGKPSRGLIPGGPTSSLGTSLPDGALTRSKFWRSPHGISRIVRSPRAVMETCPSARIAGSIGLCLGLALAPLASGCRRDAETGAPPAEAPDIVLVSIDSL